MWQAGNAVNLRERAKQGEIPLNHSGCLQCPLLQVLTGRILALPPPLAFGTQPERGWGQPRSGGSVEMRPGRTGEQYEKLLLDTGAGF